MLNSIVESRILTRCHIFTENQETYLTLPHIKLLYPEKLYHLKLPSASLSIFAFCLHLYTKCNIKLLKILKLQK